MYQKRANEPFLTGLSAGSPFHNLGATQYPSDTAFLNAIEHMPSSVRPEVDAILFVSVILDTVATFASYAKLNPGHVSYVGPVSHLLSLTTRNCVLLNTNA